MMKKSTSGYVLILVITFLPLLMLGTKYLLDIRTLWDRKASETEFLKNNSPKLTDTIAEKAEFKVVENQEILETASSKNNLSNKSEKKGKNWAKEAALKVAEKWNPALTYKQQKERLLRIADGIYNGSPTYVETRLNKAIPQIDTARETIQRGGMFNPLKVVKTADTIQSAVQGNSEKQIEYKQIIFRRIEHNYAYNAASHYYNDIHNFLLKENQSGILPDEDMIDSYCYSKENLWGICWAHYEPWTEEERRILNSSELKKIETKIYEVRKNPNDSAVQIECEKNRIKVKIDEDIGYAVPAECNVDIILTVPTNIEALDIDKQNENTYRSEHSSSDMSINKIKSTPIYQITRAYRKFLKDHFFYTRGVTVGIIPYGSSTTEKLDGMEKTEAINAFKQKHSNFSNRSYLYEKSLDKNTPVYRNYGEQNVNPYHVLKLTSNVKMIYEMLGAFYPYVSEKDYSNFISIPMIVADDLLQEKNAIKEQAEIDTKYDFRRENATHGRLKIPSSAERYRKKVLILTVNKPDWIESEKLTNLNKKYKEAIKNLTSHDMSVLGQKSTLDVCTKLKNNWENDLRIYLIKFKQQNKYQSQNSGTEVNFDYSYLNNCATENTDQYVYDNIFNQAELEEALRRIAYDIKLWAGYTEAKNVTE